jgi:hypothetical protein
VSELSEMIEVRFDLDEPATWIGCGLDEPSDVRGVAAPSEPTGDVMVDDNDDEEEPTRGAGACKRSAAEAPMSVPGFAAESESLLVPILATAREQAARRVGAVRRADDVHVVGGGE